MEPAALAAVVAAVAVSAKIIDALRRPGETAVLHRGGGGAEVASAPPDTRPRAAPPASAGPPAPAAAQRGVVAALSGVNWLVVIAALGTLATVVVCFMIIFDLGRARPFSEDDRKWAQGIVASVVSFWIGVAVGAK